MPDHHAFPPLLSNTLERCAKALSAPRTPVVVFDLDGTVFDNGPRTWAILAEFAEVTERSLLRRALDDLPHTGMPYLLSEALERVGFVDDELVDEAGKFWAKRFFTHDYQKHDVPVTGAVPFIRRCFEAGATVVYLSGRDVPGMAVGCVESLHSYGLPIGLARTALVLKPEFEQTDLEFKTEAIEFIDGLGEVVASFDNEPGNCNLFLERWPEALIGLIETTHAPGAPDLDGRAVRFKDFLS